MRKARVRVEAKRMPLNAGRDERMRNIAGLLRALKKACGDYGILQEYKEHQYFVRNTDKKRRKQMQREQTLRNLGTETYKDREERDW